MGHLEQMGRMKREKSPTALQINSLEALKSESMPRYGHSFATQIEKVD